MHMLNKISLSFLTFLFFFNISFADQVIPSKEIQETLTEKSDQDRYDKNFGLYGSYSYMDLIIPGKYGFNLYKSFQDKNTQYEFQYLKGELSVPALITDLGKMTDQRFTFLRRKFSDDGNFNVYYGLSYISFDATLGSALLNNVSAGNTIPHLDLIDIKTLGFDFGLGHRWYFKNCFSLGVDWFSFSQPLITLKKEAAYMDAQTTSQTDRDNVKKAIDVITYFPRLSFLKINVGVAF